MDLAAQPVSFTCHICCDELSDTAIEYFNENAFLIKNGVCEGYLCEKHWCRCMPMTTPWSWMRQCRLCAKSICKSCRRDVTCGEICLNCSIEWNRRH